MVTLVLCPNCGAENRVDQEKAAAGSPVCGKCKSELNVKAPGHPIHATDSTFENDVVRAGLPVLVDFWAEWCGPCKTFDPTLKQYARDMAGRLRVVKVNVDQCPYVAQKYGISSIPTLVLFRGLEVGRISGAVPLENLKAFVGRYVT